MGPVQWQDYIEMLAPSCCARSVPSLADSTALLILVFSLLVIAFTTPSNKPPEGEIVTRPVSISLVALPAPLPASLHPLSYYLSINPGVGVTVEIS